MLSSVWITGAHGFIGRHLARRLAADGARVVGLGHGAWPVTEAEAWGVAHWLNGDIRASNLQSLLKAEGSPDQIYHLAGGSAVGAAVLNPLEDFHRSVTMTAELLEWMRLESPETRLIAVSSAAVYGAGHLGPIGEGRVGVPFSPYGRHKLMMEQACRGYAADYGMAVVVARLFSVYGVGLKKQLLWDLSAKLAAGGAPVLGGSGDELRDWTEVRDVVRALELVAQTATPEAPTINLGTGRGTSVRDVARLAIDAWPTRASPVFNGQARTGDPFSLVADNTALSALGFEWRVPVDQGIADYMRWSRGQLEAAE